MIDSIWAWVSAPTPVPASGWLLAALVIGASLALSEFVWVRTRLLATWVHETGHAVVALLTGRSVRGIRLEADTSGTTHHAGTQNRLALALTAFAGYPAPAISGLLIAAAVAAEHPRWAVAGMILLCVLMLPLQRSWRGLVVTGVTAAAGWLLVQANPTVGTLALCALAGYLLAASPRTIVDLRKYRSQASLTSERHSDADALSRLTGIPALMWEAIFVVTCAVCIWRAVVSLLG